MQNNVIFLLAFLPFLYNINIQIKGSSRRRIFVTFAVTVVIILVMMALNKFTSED